MAQNYPQGYFITPIEGKLLLAGNFGEIRKNHFHGGLDIRTEGREGKRVLAAADGYVSLISISASGYGKRLHITHSNGYTTVYAHLKIFSGEILKYCLDQQHKREQYEIDIQLDPDVLKVKQGDLIALSGNSGGSQAPHLHFEIRDGSCPLNPLNFGIAMIDSIRPRYKKLAVYPMNDSSYVNGVSQPKKFSIHRRRYGKYYLSSSTKILVKGEIGFGISFFDQMKGSGNILDPYIVELLKNNKVIYRHVLDKYCFHENRYLNSHIDYNEKTRTGLVVHQSFIDPNNKLQIYKDVVNNGIVRFNTAGGEEFKYRIIDYEGNVSELNFIVSLDSNRTKFYNPIKKQDSTVTTKKFSYSKRNLFKTENVSIDMPANILYHDMDFKYRTTKKTETTYALTHHISTTNIPLHSYFKLHIKADVPDSLRTKACIVKLGYKNTPKYRGGSMLGNYISTSIREFGKYTVMVDTVSPSIRALNIYPNKNLRNQRTITIRIYDGLSGIMSYRATIDGKWFLMEYDAKYNRLTGYLDKSLPSGKHELNLFVVDKRGNRKEYTTSFNR